MLTEFCMTWWSKHWHNVVSVPVRGKACFANMFYLNQIQLKPGSSYISFHNRHCSVKKNVLDNIFFLHKKNTKNKNYNHNLHYYANPQLFILPSTCKASSSGPFCMRGIHLGVAVTLRQSWPIKFVTANRAVKAERNGKCAARACRRVSAEGREDSGSLRDSAAC